jgi:hypothetical protein
VELHRALEVVAQQRVQPDMRAATFQPVVVEHLAQGRGVEVVVARELDALIADFGDFRQRVGQVALAVVPHRIELHSDLGSHSDGVVRGSARGSCYS